MDNREAGRIMMIGFDGTDVDPEVRRLFEAVRPAGVVLFQRNIITVDQTKALVGQLRETARQYMDEMLLIAVDHEGGQVHRFGGELTQFPGNLALGRLDSEATAESVGYGMGMELNLLGVDINFAPVLDLLSLRENPQTLTRSYGGAPIKTARLGAAFIKGLEKAGIPATAKHFPGLGNCRIDSHIQRPVIESSFDELMKNDLVPFRIAVDKGVPLVMTAHAAYPALDDSGSPATFSRPVIEGILRERLEYKGAVITDALEMGAVTETLSPEKVAPAAFSAGCDLLLACRDHQYILTLHDNLQKFLESNEMPERRWMNSIRRIEDLRNRIKKTSIKKVDWRELLDKNAELAQSVALNSLELIRDTEGLIPLKPGTTLLVSKLNEKRTSEVFEKGTFATIFIDYLRKKGFHINESIERDVTPDDSKSVRVLLNERPLSRRRLRELSETAGPGSETIFIDAGVPVDNEKLPDHWTVINTYSSCRFSMEAAAGLLCGAD